MNDKTISLVSRRKFIQIIGCGACGGLAAAGTNVLAGGHAKVNPEDPQPKALGYVEDSAMADKDKFPQFADGSMCSKCQLYSGGDGKAYGPCGIFPGKEVSAIGWCSAFAAKG